MISVVIVEDSDDIREGLTFIINSNAGYNCVNTFANAEDAVLGMEEANPDVVLMDINLPGMSGVECVRQIKPLFPNTQFVMCTVYEDDEYVFEALKVGATGYILKKTEPDQILTAIREVYEGGSPMSTQIARKVIQSFQKPAVTEAYLLLSPREQEILHLLAKGYRYKEISDQLFLSTETVRTHVRNIYTKLEVQSRTDALNKAFPKS
jgi:DNA-binding NarL/FixJ family response regulator